MLGDLIKRLLGRGDRPRALPGEESRAPDWRVLTTYGSGLEADIAIARLEAADIVAIRDTNDTVGLFGPGFQGPSARSITVRVPATELEAAREELGLTSAKA